MEVLRNVIDHFAQSPAEGVFILTLIIAFVGLFYYFFRFNRDVFNAITILLVVNGLFVIIQVIVYLWLREIWISVIILVVHILSGAIEAFLVLRTTKQRIGREQESKIAILPFLMEDDVETSWNVGYGVADLLSRILQAYDISILDPYRVAVGFVRRDLSDIANALEWARMLDADFLITGTARVVRDNVQIKYKIINLEDTREWQRRRILLPKEQVFEMSRRIVNDLVSLFDLKIQNDSGLNHYNEPTVSVSAWNKYCEGRKLQLEGSNDDVEEAIAVYGQAVEIDSAFTLAEIATVEAYLSLARRRVSEEDEFLQTLETAYRLALRAVRRTPEIYETQNIMGEVFVFLSGGSDQELFRRAQTRFIEAVRLNPDSAKSWYNLALINKYYTEEEDETGYQGFLQRAINADPSFVPARVALARYLIDQNDFKRAEEEYQQALNFNPNNIQALNELGHFYINESKAPQAVAVLQKSKELNERNSQTRYNLALAFLRMENFGAAEEEFWAAIAYKPSDPKPYKELADLMEQKKKYPEAMGVLYEYLSFVEDKTEKIKVQRRIRGLMQLAQETLNATQESGFDITDDGETRTQFEDGDSILSDISAGEDETILEGSTKSTEAIDGRFDEGDIIDLEGDGTSSYSRPGIKSIEITSETMEDII